MSDRDQVIDMHTKDGQHVTGFSDGETGTFRLFVDNVNQCADFTVEEFHTLGERIRQIIQESKDDPWKNPEHRRERMLAQYRGDE